MKVQHNKILGWLIMMVLVFTWGSSFILMKKGLRSFSADEVGGIRIMVAMIFLLIPALIGLKRIPKNKLGAVILSGLIGNAIPAFLFAAAQTHIDSSVAGMLNSTTTIFTLIVGVIFFHIKVRWYNVLGVFIGLVGVLGLLGVSGSGEFAINLSWGALILCATALYAINLNLIKRYLKDVHSVTLTSMAFLVPGIPISIYILGFTDVINQVCTSAAALNDLYYILTLGIGGSALALFLYYYLIKITHVLFAASVTYLMPIVAFGWGISDGEKFGWSFILWILMIIVGVLLVNPPILIKKDQALTRKRIST